MASLLASTVARAQDKQACVSAYEEGQQLRKASKLISARAKLLVCAQESCPAVVRKDCTVWVAEVDQITPTVVLAARAPNGKDAVDVAVSLDGKPFVTRLDGKAVAVDPGPHTFRFELAGEAPHDETIVVHEGERNRSVLADFQPAAPAAAAPSAVAVPMRAAPTPAGAYVLAAFGVAGLGVFGAFGLMGLADKSDLDQRNCKPDCPQSDVDKAKEKFLIADVGLGVGVASIVLATVIYATKGEVPAEPASAASLRFDVAPTRNGAAFGLRGSF